MEKLQYYETYATQLQTLLGLNQLPHGARPWLEGSLALTASLVALALRRQKRLFTPAGFIMLSCGWIADLITPREAPLPPWTPYGRALAVILFLFGASRLLVEGAEVALRGRRAQISPIVAEVIRIALYALVLLVVLRLMLHFNFAVLLSIPAAGTLGVGWVLQGNFFKGLLIQSQRPFLPGDWVRFGNYLGKVQGSGWRATRVLTRSNESLELPNSLLSHEVLTNYSTVGPVADEVFVSINYSESPAKVEEAISKLLGDIPELLRAPPPQIDPWEFGDTAIRYRVKFWMADYGVQERARAQVNRSLWYAVRRGAIKIAGGPARPAAPVLPGNGAGPEQLDDRLIAELRRVYLLSELADEELRLLIGTARIQQFGRGEILMREGEIGDRFYILRRGVVEVLANAQDGAGIRVIRQIEDRSEKNFFGEIALLTGERRSATIRAVTEVEVLEISRDGFARLFKAHPETASAIADIAAARMAETRERAAARSTPPVVVRGGGHKVLVTMRRIFDF